MMKTASALDKRIKEVYGINAHLDGITNMAMFKETQPKILWILKEANDGGKIKSKKEDLDAREFHKDVATYDNGKKEWKNTFKPIIASSYGVIEYEDVLTSNNRQTSQNEIKNPNRLLSYENIPQINDCALNIKERAKMGGCFANVMERIAIINVNKCSGGDSSSDNREIKEIYKDSKVSALLKEQIKQINPDVIINCSSVDNLTMDLKMNYKMHKMRNIDVYYNNDKLLIQYRHPGQSNHKDYYEDIVRYYAKWKKLHPIK